MTSNKLKQIAVSERNYVFLKTLGFAGESFNDVISRLLSSADTSVKKSERGGLIRQRATPDQIKPDRFHPPIIQCDKLYHDLISQGVDFNGK